MSSEARTVSWSINKAQGSLSVDKSSILLEEEAQQEVITVTRLGDGRITATTSDSSICTVSVNETTGEVTVTAVDDGICTVTINCAEGSNYTAPVSVEVNVTCEIVLEDLDELSWAEIAQIIQSGEAANKFAVGATKTITFPSQITVGSGKIDANSSWKAVILGIDHNSSIEGTNRVHFCIGKTTDGKEMGFRKKQMNSSDTNSGGWNGSAMKTWLNGTFYNALPTDLKAVITACTKYTDNTGNPSDSKNNVTSTSQKIWLMAEFEVFGIRTGANQYEQNKQAQYDYYKNGNSKVHYSHESQDSAISCWLRSPYTLISFRAVISNGGSGYYYARGEYGVVPCFTIS